MWTTRPYLPARRTSATSRYVGRRNPRESPHCSLKFTPSDFVKFAELIGKARINFDSPPAKRKAAPSLVASDPEPPPHRKSPNDTNAIARRHDQVLIRLKEVNIHGGADNLSKKTAPDSLPSSATQSVADLLFPSRYLIFSLPRRP